MDKVSGQKSAYSFLYPQHLPFNQLMLDVGDGHSIYVEECGNPEGVPVVVLHGGPGGGCSPTMRRYFDPNVFRVVLFDQRGCGRSRPSGSVDHNTTWHLVADIERIREHLGIDRWIVFGGSWGATLALAYGQTHPERARQLVLRGVFAATQRELDWFYGGGAGLFWPDLWERFSEIIPEDERHDLIAAYHNRLFCGDRATEVRFGRQWSQWENALASIESDGATGEAPADYARVFARIENHYFTNKAFMEEGQLLRDMDRLRGVGGTIVQGRFDMICPPTTAWDIHKAWPGSELHLVGRAGHALSEPGISAQLVATMDRLATTMR